MIFSERDLPGEIRRVCSYIFIGAAERKAALIIIIDIYAHVVDVRALDLHSFWGIVPASDIQQCRSGRKRPDEPVPSAGHKKR